MNARLLRLRTNGVTALWVCSVIALATGYAFGFHRTSEAVDAQGALTAQVVDLIRADENLLAQQPLLERREHHLAAALRTIELHADAATTVAHFVHDAAAVAARHQVEIVQVDGRKSIVSAPSPRLDAFTVIPLDVTLSGAYAGILATVRDLTHTRTLAQIDIAAIERGNFNERTAAGAVPHPLTAHLHVLVQRLAATRPELPAPQPPREATNVPR